MLRLWRRIKFVFNVRKSVPFMLRFFRSKEVSARKKWLSLLFLFGYLLFPWDVIPDFLILFGILDDLTVFTYITQWMVKTAPLSLKEDFRIEER
ncbi:Protein of unknown function [Halobacillus alkaliphilus]|uniref:DUF1232 domain-containing protein n=1 Tax=Halobacillus alkaliphilus TaxID=396056 RepID=A0A1I2P072_9BACI|nr:YkvA family protein [Halobacillus alkaliphilus]SFG07126.1 Protein of unknown function [Halobacillus alkaliphilus]